jgi:hypothetical protein
MIEKLLYRIFSIALDSALLSVGTLYNLAMSAVLEPALRPVHPTIFETSGGGSSKRVSETRFTSILKT